MVVVIIVIAILVVRTFCECTKSYVAVFVRRRAGSAHSRVVYKVSSVAVRILFAKEVSRLRILLRRGSAKAARSGPFVVNQR